MSIFGGVIIGGLNAFMHQIQGTTIVPKAILTTTATPTTGA
jgi:hypothetical protein